MSNIRVIPPIDLVTERKLARPSRKSARNKRNRAAIYNFKKLL